MKKVIAAAGGTLLATGLCVAVPSPGTAATNPTSDPAAVAKDYIQENPGRVRAGTDDAFTATRTATSPDGSSHVRFSRTYKGLPVVGGDFVVHLSTAEKVTGTSVAQAEKIAVSTAPKVTKGVAQQKALGASKAASPDAAASRLVVDARSGTPALAYRTVVTGVQADGQTPSRRIVLTDASSGSVRSSEETILTPIKVGTVSGAASPASASPTATATGTGRGIFIGTVPLSTSTGSSGYSLVDAVRGNGRTCDLKNRTSGTCTTFTDADNAWGNGSYTDRASAAVDAHYGASTTFDYFKNVQGRNGIFGNGTGVPSRVHYGNSYINAFWDGAQMTYGDGSGNRAPLVAIDVAGHEMTHGVTENTAGLGYSGDAGGLNEATSDIFGTMVEFYANSSADTPDFLIGEKIDINGDGTPLRYMDDPSKDGASYRCWSSAVPGSDPHYSSGVGNHLFFLLANGSGQTTYGNSPTCNGSTVTGIGRDKAAKIWFNALDHYMTSTETYAKARLDTVQAATDLYGASSAEVAAVKATWSAVNVS
ncbi:M4 family metallopeptidase [Aeromicrobium fastidiosum]|uniref:Neutral metalloproteinase n=1 Tax=Aeromicrobium fastidiosum TaxID=52699 RepID=A0A641AHN5_9ACTN|nr:M4 family metallopeptidase [Aeromicrobium fastidiosum]KAA1373610.1 M4 family metallopeptidase [Aeromicrobium fastidiosum]MBP2391160.1 Zn-dependent metalloprotease [Aeromicrobium fastidiosum]